MSDESKKDLDTIKKYREQIHDIDDKILSLLSMRQGLARDLGRVKREKGIRLPDIQDELKSIERLVSGNYQNLDDRDVKNIFTEILSASRSIYQKSIIAFLGPEGTFSHEAAISHFGKSASFRAADNLDKVFELVEKDVCSQGIVPIENSYEGSVNRTLDLFYRYDLNILAEIFVRIRHQLLSRADGLEDVKMIYSHPMAIAQCRIWINGHIPGIPLKEMESTSKAAKIASEDPEAAAIASRFSGESYNLNILEENIEDDPDNVTRFLVIGKNRSGPTGKDKTSIMFFLGHKPGALHKALGALAEANINMTRIESRPMKIRNWEYLFFVDLEGHESDENLNMAIKKMEKECVFMKQLGSYPAGR
jgi:chorismate mutase/prephenate dehydratase